MESNATATIAGIDWRELLANEVARDPRGKAGVADRLRGPNGKPVSRAYISRVMSTGSSRIDVVSDKFIQRVLGLLHVVTCPATQQEQPREECRKAHAAAPTHNPQAMRVWRSCQTCPLKPHKEAS